MRCPDMNDMAAYLDATLSEDARTAMRDHFRTCRMCALALAELRELLGLPPHDPGLLCTTSLKSLPAAARREQRESARERKARVEHCVFTTAG